MWHHKGYTALATWTVFKVLFLRLKIKKKSLKYDVYIKKWKAVYENFSEHKTEVWSLT